MTSWVKKEKQEKASFCLRLKKKKSPNPAHHPSWGLSSGRALLVGSAAGVGGRGLEQQLDNEFIILFFLVILDFFKTFSNSLGVTQAPGSSAGRCRVRDRRDTGHKRRCVNSNEKAPIRTTKTTIRGPLTGQREGAHPYRSEKLPPSLQKIQ